MKADAIVLGSPTYYGSVSAFTKAFMERMYAFRHLRLLTRGKVGGVVAVGSANEQVVVDHITSWMRFAGMDVVGSLTAKGTICCMVCGPGEECAYATWNAYCEDFAGEDFGLEEAYEGYFEVLPDNVPYVKGSARILKKHRNMEDEPEVMEMAASLGRVMRERLRERSC